MLATCRAQVAGEPSIRARKTARLFDFLETKTTLATPRPCPLSSLCQIVASLLAPATQRTSQPPRPRRRLPPLTAFPSFKRPHEIVVVVLAAARAETEAG
jgi:hypothetical protein